MENHNKRKVGRPKKDPKEIKVTLHLMAKQKNAEFLRIHFPKNRNQALDILIDSYQQHIELGKVK